MKGFIIFIMSILICAYLLVSYDQHREKENQRKQKYLQDNKCIVSGYYGRSGEYKIYTCNGVFLRKEDEI